MADPTDLGGIEAQFAQSQSSGALHKALSALPPGEKAAAHASRRPKKFHVGVSSTGEARCYNAPAEGD
jgi:hypothetical protein